MGCCYCEPRCYKTCTTSKLIILWRDAIQPHAWFGAGSLPTILTLTEVDAVEQPYERLASHVYVVVEIKLRDEKNSTMNSNSASIID